MQNLKSKYEQKEMRVSHDLWSKLEDKLDQAPAKEKKPKIIWLKYAAVILLMIGLGGSFWMMNDKIEVKENTQFANQSKREKTETPETNQNNNIEKVISETKNPESNKEKLVLENVKTSTLEPNKKETLNTNAVSEPIISDKKEEQVVIPQSEEKLAQNDASPSLSTQKAKERPKYITSSELLFGVEIDKAKSEKPKSAMGINTSKPKNDLDNLNPKRIKLFGITLYDKDSITTK